MMITTWSRGAPDDFMPEAMLVETSELAKRHPWFKARARLLLELLRQERILPPASVLEVGCGWGINLTALEQAGYKAAGLDISRRALELIDAPHRSLIEGDLNKDIPCGTALHDAVLALDVIEHLDDDRGVVQKISTLVKPSGIAVLSVPAMPELFSEFDRIQGHRRRYLPHTLKEAFRDTGFELRRIFWWGQWMVPLMRLTRSRVKGASPAKTYAGYLRLPPWPFPLLMQLAFAVEKQRALKGKLQRGSSLFAVADRRV